MRCPRCYEWINAHTVQISFSFDQCAGITDLYMVNPDLPLKEVVEEVQRALIRRAIVRANGVMVRAAEIAGMKYTTFWEMARRLDVAPRKQHEVAPQEAAPQEAAPGEVAPGEVAPREVAPHEVARHAVAPHHVTPLREAS